MSERRPAGAGADRNAVARWRRNLQTEIDSAHLYRAMAANAGNERLGALYAELAAAKEGHANLWRGYLAAAHAKHDGRPSWRKRLLGFVARRLGAGLVAPMVASEERQRRTMYDDQPEAASMSLAADGRAHARRLHRITGGASGAMLTRFGGRHRLLDGNALRAAVLGANDGLVSNFSLVMGVAGATDGGQPVVIAGIAGLLAGALSMALGEWLSVQSAREMYAHQLAIEADELAAFPEEETEELRLIYEMKGIEPRIAREMADRIISGDRRVALDTMSREELGIDPGELGGSAWVAAITSFVLFAVGAAIPLVPFLAASGVGAITTSAGLSGIALFALGAAISALTGRHPVRAGLRQLAFGLAAAAITFGIGSLLGAAIT
jgi:VIT1/CCC1 family predicted Fe2+/Mn2+ transporter